MNKKDLPPLTVTKNPVKIYHGGIDVNLAYFIVGIGLILVAIIMTIFGH